jgi:hypothetical protein
MAEGGDRAWGGVEFPGRHPSRKQPIGACSPEWRINQRAADDSRPGDPEIFYNQPLESLKENSYFAAPVVIAHADEGRF